MSNIINNYIYDWNEAVDKVEKPAQLVEIHDETLRDGLQSPAANIPSIDDTLKILELSDAIGLNSVTIGFPAVSENEKLKTLSCAKFVDDEKLSFQPSCTARTVFADVVPIVEISQKINCSMEASIFLGSSHIRREIEGWTIHDLKKFIKESVGFAAKENLNVAFVTEDTTRSKPDDIENLYLTAIESGATRLTLCDTVGHATPNGILNLVKFVRNMLDKRGLSNIKIDFHGHMDRGLGLWNAISALSAGANRIHVCALGVGERTGNVATEQLLINLKLLSWINNDLTRLKEYLELVSRSFGYEIPVHQPIIGGQAFETASGVHAAAILKAKNRNDLWLANRVYSAIPAEWLGAKQKITIGPMSGKANVIDWLQEHGLCEDKNLIDFILMKAKQNNMVLTDTQLMNYTKSFNLEKDKDR